MTKQKPIEWEKDFYKKFKGNLYKDNFNGSFTTCGEDVKYFIRSLLSQQKKKMIKPCKYCKLPKCTLCWDKGYATQKQDKRIEILFCRCDRGKQLKELMSRLNKYES